MTDIHFLPDVEPMPIAKGDRVKVNTYDWERGDIDITGTVTKVEHETAWVRVDDALVFDVPIADCKRVAS
jgi:ribosome maturation factor RimP